MRSGQVQSHQPIKLSKAETDRSLSGYQNKHISPANIEWRKASVLEPNRKRYDTYIHPSGLEVIRQDYSEQYRALGEGDETRLSPTYRGGPKYGGQDRNYPMYTGQRWSTTFDAVNAQAPGKTMKPQCHYETIARVRPKAEALTSDVQYHSSEITDPERHEDIGTGKFDSEDFSHKSVVYPSDHQVQFHPDTDVMTDEQYNNDNDEDDNKESIFEMSPQEPEAEKSDRSETFQRLSSPDESDRHSEIYETLSSFNDFIQNFPLGKNPAKDEVTTATAEVSTESVLAVYDNDSDGEDDSDDVGASNSGDGAVEDEEEKDDRNSWVKFSYSPAISNASNPSGHYREGLSRSDTTTIVLPYQLAAHMRKDADASPLPTARIVLAGVDMSAGFSRLVHSSSL
ncbi:hypothetical protein PoB_006209300 [Plakobranchus ocellatus]|uniref:Uncharacterized protein n=1 Tax=Plakobranchus ocellatus TaxID=259542 RepID=A0AAV4CUQ5_9GAST|nr:hypothetical protein PoB_006209300 [Plakobranchus ocellatus]